METTHSRTNEALTKRRANISRLYILCYMSATKTRMKRSVANLPETTDTMPFADDGLSETSEEEEGSEILRRMSASSAAEAC